MGALVLEVPGTIQIAATPGAFRTRCPYLNRNVTLSERFATDFPRFSFEKGWAENRVVGSPNRSRTFSASARSPGRSTALVLIPLQLGSQWCRVSRLS